MDANKYTFEEQTFRHLQPIAIAMGGLSTMVFFLAMLLGEYLLGVRVPVLYLYGVISTLSALFLWRAKNLQQLWLGGIGGMVSAAVGYSTMVSNLSNPELWFFSTGLSLTFVVIVAFHYVFHYIISTALSWLVIIGISQPTFQTRFDYALGTLIVVAAITMGSFTIVVLRRTRRAAYDLQNKLHELAHVDALTGIPNRRAFMDTLQSTVDATPPQLHFLMLDIDDFKSINDSFGHDIGDQALITIARTIAQQAAPHQYGRMGGEEFAMAAIATETQARALAQQLVEAVHALFVEGRKLSVSIGLTAMRPSDTPSHLLRRADEALYLAKRSGKNQYQVL